MNKKGGRGLITEPVWFGGCSPTVPLCDTGGHAIVGADRGQEGQLPWSIHTTASASHCPLHLG